MCVCVHLFTHVYEHVCHCTNTYRCMYLCVFACMCMSVQMSLWVCTPLCMSMKHVRQDHCCTRLHGSHDLEASCFEACLLLLSAHLCHVNQDRSSFDGLQASPFPLTHSVILCLSGRQDRMGCGLASKRA